MCANDAGCFQICALRVPRCSVVKVECAQAGLQTKSAPFQGALVVVETFWGAVVALLHHVTPFVDPVFDAVIQDGLRHIVEQLDRFLFE